MSRKKTRNQRNVEGKICNGKICTKTRNSREGKVLKSKNDKEMKRKYKPGRNYIGKLRMTKK